MPPRQSTRLKAKPKTDDGESKYVLSSDDEYESDEPLAGPSSATTKVRGSKRKRKAAAPSSSATKSAATSATTLLGQKDDSGRPTKKLRGKRGFLQQIAEMPLELLFEVCYCAVGCSVRDNSLWTRCFMLVAVDLWSIGPH